MKRIFLAAWILALFTGGSLGAQGLDRLAARTAEDIVRFFSDKFDVRTAVVRFDNFTELSGLATQKYYQLLTSGLESQKVFLFDDLMVEIQKDSGTFNVSRLDKYNYLISLRLTRNRDKIGAGISIFSRIQDRVVHIQYLEEMMNPGENTVLDVADYGFKGAGFARRNEIKTDKDLLAFKDIVTPGGDHWFFFLYPARLEVFKNETGQLKRVQAIPLAWGRPWWPSLNPEGRLAAHRRGESAFIAAGCNSSPRSFVFTLENGQWRASGSVDFIVFSYIRLNETDYLLGGKFEEAKNNFKDKIYLSPPPEATALPGTSAPSLFEKQVVPFYALDVSMAEDGSVIALHMVDKNYRYRIFGANFQEIAQPEGKRGGAMAVLNNRWLACSDFSTGNDRIYFNKISGGGSQPVYQNPTDGEIISISAGAWDQSEGFWVLVKNEKGGQFSYNLQFWSENNG